MGILETIEQDEDLQKELIRVAKKSKFKKKVMTTLFAVVAVVLLMVSVLFYGRSQGTKKAEEEIAELMKMIEEQNEQIQKMIEQPVVVNDVSPQIILQKIQSELSDISELASIQYLYTDAAKFTDSRQIKNWNIPFTEKSFVLKWSGTIKAGVNLEKIDIDVKEHEKKVVISMPAAEILSYETGIVEVLDEKNNIFNSISVDDKIEFDAETEEEMKQTAIENGILLHAQANAEDIIKRLIMINPELEEYEIAFKVQTDK